MASSAIPYLVNAEPNVSFVTIANAGDVIGTKTDGSDYRLAGTPDGLGAYDNGDGTFTLLMNHEFGNNAGVVREHGATGSFISQLVIDKETLSIVSAEDAIKTVELYDVESGQYVTSTEAFSRFCSSNLAKETAFYNAETGLGSTARIYMTGEESGNNGRAVGLVATGEDAGTLYELASLGNFSWENSVASDFQQDKTIVIGTDDATGGQVYVYVGEKQAEGNDIEKAGLVGGQLYGIKVEGVLNEVNETGVNGRFTLQEQGDNGDVSAVSGSDLQAESVAEGVTGWLRPEDGSFDPTNPNVFYFTTTNSFEGNSRLYRLTFDDITDPLSGGSVEAVLEGNEGQRMFDNLTVADDGKVYLQEDPGGNDRLSKVWVYDPVTDVLSEVAEHNPVFFAPGASQLLTTNEESSGVIDVSGILGDADTQVFLLDVQAHYNFGDPEIVEGGQLRAMVIEKPNLTGDAEDNVLNGSQADESLRGFAGNDTINAGSGNDIVYGGEGDDDINGGAGDDSLRGGDGNDIINGGEGLDRILGGDGNDTVNGDAGNDVLYGHDGDDAIDGGTGNDTIFGGEGSDDIQGGAGNDNIYGGEGDDIIDGGADNDIIRADGGNDTLIGGAGSDSLNGGAGDDILIGGAGFDSLAGGTGADTFVFEDVSDSPFSPRDIIRDFSSAEGDLIDLSGIDAIFGGGDDSFTIVAKLTGVAGQLAIYYNPVSGNADITGDIDGDGKADFALTVFNTTSLEASDFIL